MLIFMISVSESVNRLNPLYLKKLDDALDGNGSDSKSSKNILKTLRNYFKSRKKRKRLKIVLLALGITGVFFLIRRNRHLAILFISKCRTFFMSSDEDMNSNIAEVSNKAKGNHGKWVIIGGAIILGGLGGFKFVSGQQKEVEEEITKSALETFKNVVTGEFRIFIGTGVFFLGYPVAYFISPKAGAGLMVLGWQIATLPPADS